MSDAFLSILSSHAERTIELSPGACVFRSGDVVSSVFLVLAGRVSLVRNASDGTRLILHRTLPGNILAEASIFSDIYHCDALVIAQCQLRAMSISRFRQLEKSKPELSDKLASYLAERLQTARTQAATLSLKTVAERLDAWLGTPQNKLPAKGQWRDLADMLAVTPEALSRELAKRRHEKGLT